MTWSDKYNLPKAQIKEISRLRKEILKQVPFIQRFDETDGWGNLSTIYLTMDGEWLEIAGEVSFRSALITLFEDKSITKTLVWYPKSKHQVYPVKYEIRKV